MVSLLQDKRSVFDKVLDQLVAMLCCECRGRSLNLSSLFSATMFLGAALRGLRGLGAKPHKMVGLGGWSPPESFSLFHFHLVVKKFQNSVASSTGVISTNDIVSALVP